MQDNFQKAIEQRDWFLCKKYLRDVLISIDAQELIEVTLIWVDTYLNFLLKDYSDRSWIDDMYTNIRDSFSSGVSNPVPKQLNQASKNMIITSIKNVLRNLRGLTIISSREQRVEFASEAMLSIVAARLLVEKYVLAPELFHLHNATNKSAQKKMNSQVALAIKVANHPDILALEQRLWSNLIRIISSYI